MSWLTIQQASKCLISAARRPSYDTIQENAARARPRYLLASGSSFLMSAIDESPPAFNLATPGGLDVPLLRLTCVSPASTSLGHGLQVHCFLYSNMACAVGRVRWRGCCIFQGRGWRC
jgi:hypothetical protein